MTSRWRDIARRVIRDVIADVGLDDEVALRKALRGAYPFGARELHPYKIWCDEVRVQTGRKVGKKMQQREGQGQGRLF